MKRNARTDLHRPSTIKPEDYFLVACDYYGGSGEAGAYAEDRKAFREHMAVTGGKFDEQHNNGTCYICGARASYVAKFHYLPTNSYIVTGMDCAEKLGIGDDMAFKSFRKRIKAGMKLAKGKHRAQEILTEANLLAAWAIYDQAGDDLPRQEATIVDIVDKVVHYGNISDGQKKLVASLLRQIAERPVKEAARAAQYAAAEPVPQTDERVKVTGKIVSTKSVETQYGTTRKMLVVTDAGYKVFGTVPAEFMNAVSITGEHDLRGFRVEFSARLERSRDDEKFGFFSRPTKPVILERAAVKDIGQQADDVRV